MAPIHLSKKKDRKIAANTLSSRRLVLKKRIKDALAKYSGIDVSAVKIRIRDEGIILDGIIDNIYQYEDANDIVNILTKGDTPLINNLKVEPEYFGAEAFTSPIKVTS